MIMPNNNQTQNNDGDQTTRTFNRILQAAETHWGEFYYDPSCKIARGVLATTKGDTYIGELSYNDVKGHIYLTVRCTPKDALAPTHIHALHRFTNCHKGLGHVTWDAEDHLINVGAASALVEAATQQSVGAVFTETMALLEDENLLGLLT